MKSWLGKGEPASRWRRRGGTLASILVLFVVGLPVVSSSAAYAETYPPGTRIDCNTPGIEWQSKGFLRVGTKFTIVSAVPTFFVGDGRSVDNNLDQPVSATFTSQRSTTVTVTTMIGTTTKLTEEISRTVSVTVMQSRMTAIGVSVTATVPPHSRLIAEYGVAGFAVTYDAQFFIADSRACTASSISTGNTTSAPTVNEGWRLSVV